MATGYTYEVSDGTITDFDKFALTCARAFGAAIDQKEDAPGEIKIPEFRSYHLASLHEASDELKKFKANRINKESWGKGQLANEIEELRFSVQKNHAEIQRMKNMLDKVNAWAPPTPDHQGLKDFMIQQLTDSIKCDNRESYYQEEVVKLNATDPDTLYDLEIKRLENNIAYHKEELAKDFEKYKRSTTWILELQASL